MQCQRQEEIVEGLKVYSGLVGLVEVAERKRRKKKWMMIMMNVFHKIYFFFPVALRPNAGHGLLILEVF